MKFKLKTIGLLFLSGLLWSLAHPSAFPLITKTDNYILNTGYQEIFAWFGLLPFLFAMKGKKGFKSFLTAFGFAMFFFAISQYWINIAIVIYGNIPIFLSIPLFMLLMIELSLQWGLSIYIGFEAAKRFGHPLSLTLPITFTAGELLRNHFVFDGYPWSNIAYSQYLNLPILQTASLWGIYPIVFMIVLCNVVLFELIEFYRSKDREDFRKYAFPKVGFILLLLMLGFSFSYGSYKVKQNDKAEMRADKFKAAMIQGNIDQEIKNKSAIHAHNIIDVYKGLSKQVPDDVELVIWPEAAFPYNIARNTPHFKKVFKYTYEKLPWMLLTGVSTHTGSGKSRKYFNSVFLINKDMQVIDRFDKTHLVPFGEYVPFKDLLRVNQIVPGAGMFYPGSPGYGMSYKKRRFGVLICYEGIFPEISQSYINSGKIDFLINITNDAWYGVSSAAYQHLAFYSFRAVETGKAILRAANTGFSAWVDSSGRIHNKTALFSRTLLVAEVPILNASPLYGTLGDYPAFALTVLWIFWFIKIFIFRKTRK